MDQAVDYYPKLENNRATLGRDLLLRLDRLINIDRIEYSQGSPGNKQKGYSSCLQQSTKGYYPENPCMLLGSLPSIHSFSVHSYHPAFGDNMDKYER